MYRGRWRTRADAYRARRWLFSRARRAEQVQIAWSRECDLAALYARQVIARRVGENWPNTSSSEM